VVYYDPDQKNYFSYDIVKGTTRNLTASIDAKWIIWDNDSPDSAIAAYALVGWVGGDKVLLHDQCYIWLISTPGNEAPMNITGGYGRRHNIVFHIIGERSRDIYKNGERLLLSAYDRDTKDNGFFRQQLGKPGDPEKLTMGRYVYYLPDEDVINDGSPPV